MFLPQKRSNTLIINPDFRQKWILSNYFASQADLFGKVLGLIIWSKFQVIGLE